MKSAADFVVVLVTAPDPKVARALARTVLQAGLAACANLLPGVESHYWWQGRLARGQEILLILKTRRRLLPALEKLVVKQHPYDTPEFLVLPITAGNNRYLQWIADSATGHPVRVPPAKRPKRA